MRRVFVRTPGGKTVERYVLRKPSRAVCSITGQKLHGIPHMRPTAFRNLAKSKKRPQRAFGGVLSSRAARRVITTKARNTLSEE